MNSVNNEKKRYNTDGVKGFLPGNPGRKKGSKGKATIFRDRIFEILQERDSEVFRMKIADIANIGSRFVPRVDTLIDQSQHTHLTRVEVKVSNDTAVPLAHKAGDSPPRQIPV